MKSEKENRMGEVSRNKYWYEKLIEKKRRMEFRFFLLSSAKCK